MEEKGERERDGGRLRGRARERERERERRTDTESPAGMWDIYLYIIGHRHGSGSFCKNTRLAVFNKLSVKYVLQLSSSGCTKIWIYINTETHSLSF